jgi:outer membrane protein assembly factor BamA
VPRLLLLLFFSIIALSELTASSICADPLTDSSFISSGYVIIREISIEGNRRTKERIILRELSFKTGDTIAVESIEKVLLLNRNRIFNTGLFVITKLELSGDSVYKKINIRLKERFYTYPIPIFELADRNFNEWWQQRGHDIHRTNIGINFQQKNVRGRNETLKIKAQAGFTKKVELGYFIPYLNKNQKTGLSVMVSYSTNKKVAFETDSHKLNYTESDENLRKRFYTTLTLSHRGKFYQTHFASLSFFYNTIDDTIAFLNPRYFLNSRTSQAYFSLKYAFLRDFRDQAFYALKGSYLRLEAEKLGLGIFHDINQINFRVEYAKYFKPGKKVFLSAGFIQKISFPYVQPYYNFKSMGYDRDYVSGYELYVIDGQHFSLAKVNLKYQLFSANLKADPLPFNQFRTIPFAIYVKAYSDGGYVVDNTYNPKNTRLANKFLLGGGVGLDFVTYYDLVFRVEYSINRMLEHGLYLHMKATL